VLEEDQQEVLKRAAAAQQVPRVLAPEALGKVTRGTYAFFSNMLQQMEAAAK